MLGELIASWQVTPPAIWGKLPGHADFVRFDTGLGEISAWRAWLALEGRRCGMPAGEGAVVPGPRGEGARALPVAFVLSPGTLPFAARQCVLGVIVPSCDSLGRRHPLIVYQAARPHWIRKHYESHAAQPCDWQFWLARMLARHVAAGKASSFRALVFAVQALWVEQSGVEGHDARRRRMQAVIDRWIGAGPVADPAARVRGVRYLPWSDWPDRTWGAHAGNAFWLQDAEGRFVDASHRLQPAWSVLP